MPPLWVADTSVWIDLAVGGLLDAAFRLEADWGIPDLLVDELQRTPKGVELLARGVVVLELSGKQVAELAELTIREARLSPVDLAALLVTRESADLLLTGDSRLRAFSEELGVEVHGTLWLLDQFVVEALISAQEAAAALERMVAGGSRLPDAEVHRRLLAWSA